MLNDLDYILNFLVRKDSAARDVYKKLKELEEDLSSKLTQLWQQQSGTATKVLTGYLQKYGAQLNEAHAQAVAAGLNLHMGKGLVKVARSLGTMIWSAIFFMLMTWWATRPPKFWMSHTLLPSWIKI